MAALRYLADTNILVRLGPAGAFEQKYTVSI